MRSIQLRDSAGLTPDFPYAVPLCSCASIIGPASSERKLVEEPDAQVTALCFVLGKTTLAVGDSLGRLRGWFRIKPEDAAISLPYMLRRYRGAGIDPLSEPIYTYPVLHYQNGGLVIDEHGETTLQGVFACGEIAGGTHGRNRMMGNSLLECTVFGRRAGTAAAEKGRS